MCDRMLNVQDTTRQTRMPTVQSMNQTTDLAQLMSEGSIKLLSPFAVQNFDFLFRSRFGEIWFAVHGLHLRNVDPADVA